jgi:hypothetical protein
LHDQGGQQLHLIRAEPGGDHATPTVELLHV